MNGLKGKVREITAAMNAIRTHKERPRDVTLRSYIPQAFPGLQVEHLFADLGIDERTTQFSDLYADEDLKHLAPEIVLQGVRTGMGLQQRENQRAIQKVLLAMAAGQYANLGVGTTDPGTRFINPDVFLDPVQRGAVEASYYQDLIIKEVSIAQPTATMPKIEVSDAALRDSNEAATIEEGMVTYGTKDVKATKKARGIKVTYESIQFNSLDFVQLWFVDVGRILASSLNDLAVLAIINGDQADSSEAAQVVGVTTANTLTYKDIIRIFVRMTRLGRRPTTVIGSETSAIDYLDLTDVKNRQNMGPSLLNVRLKTPLPGEQDLYVSDKPGAKQLVFQDSSLSLVQLTAMPLMVESEKIISKQLAASYASIMTAFAKVMKNASIVLDYSLALSSYPLPTTGEYAITK